ncbi:hypothetical protein CAOG_01863 [Capsaspora owczarzaki ATCC 30864]|uniref:Rho-GAP domain-containing protein n=1 Tax=Capsaspora owczarzaki (strain ATCC 30864) TaxID=595528 RepID=A0A0D2WL98_CAPO3|nr:hypothetical protein CAOG_01863 [Capsaspora owczarzaki ATCC 30864]KJE90563.1 hypothetical protein CAOG_001863 [Capsaspora owczarzaki ATCC 30864]|eukprot:XP_004364731.2 hypothetical protein CAOG_01863 [Capsaspora owczarzaki ATCC 30864]
MWKRRSTAEGDSTSEIGEDELYMDLRDAETLLNSLSLEDQQALISTLDKSDEAEQSEFDELLDWLTDVGYPDLVEVLRAGHVVEDARILALKDRLTATQFDALRRRVLQLNTIIARRSRHSTSRPGSAYSDSSAPASGKSSRSQSVNSTMLETLGGGQDRERILSALANIAASRDNSNRPLSVGDGPSSRRSVSSEIGQNTSASPGSMSSSSSILSLTVPASTGSNNSGSGASGHGKHIRNSSSSHDVKGLAVPAADSVSLASSDSPEHQSSESVNAVPEMEGPAAFTKHTLRRTPTVDAAISEQKLLPKDLSELTNEQLIKARPVALLQLTEIMERHVGTMPIRSKASHSKHARSTFRAAFAQATAAVVNGRRDSQPAQCVFGIPLDTVLDKEKSKVERDKNDYRIAPIFLVRTFEYLMDMAMTSEGLFRKAGSANRIRILRDHCEASRGDVDLYELEAVHPNDVAAILKQFLRELPEPLLTEKFSDTFIATQALRDKQLRIESLQLLMLLLPNSHTAVLRLILPFLAHVATFSETNKMNTSNLALIFAPNVFRAQKPKEHLGKERELQVATAAAFRCMIENHEQLFTVSASILTQVEFLDQQQKLSPAVPAQKEKKYRTLNLFSKSGTQSKRKDLVKWLTSSFEGNSSDSTSSSNNDLPSFQSVSTVTPHAGTPYVLSSSKDVKKLDGIEDDSVVIMRVEMPPNSLSVVHRKAVVVYEKTLALDLINSLVAETAKKSEVTALHMKESESSTRLVNFNENVFELVKKHPNATFALRHTAA